MKYKNIWNNNTNINQCIPLTDMIGRNNNHLLFITTLLFGRYTLKCDTCFKDKKVYDNINSRRRSTELFLVRETKANHSIINNKTASGAKYIDSVFLFENTERDSDIDPTNEKEMKWLKNEKSDIKAHIANFKMAQNVAIQTNDVIVKDDVDAMTTREEEKDQEKVVRRRCIVAMDLFMLVLIHNRLDMKVHATKVSTVQKSDHMANNRIASYEKKW
ncbi:hypothetical protein RFI_16699 [Reticulomyxa filosa]|uniref:Uncharacterized protein n=1 Tax=Reticulomyxa filosa TaxID=46433 RepID=X6N5D2_RETFI|nr:hypothetical protein RFI_16699 [Reticulomyxa filosa]|eukprot:ETO20517.1 hypothetical protein RFI_16699 [Reticulomyxa filosa]